jgi:hypothetical protein
MRKLQERGESLDLFTFRDATENDIPELGRLPGLKLIMLKMQIFN